MNAKAPGTGDPVQNIMDTIAVELMESDNLRKNRTVNKELTEHWVIRLAEIQDESFKICLVAT